MDNNKEKSEHGFVKVSSNSKNTETSHNKVNKTKNSTFKVVVTSFISGIVGASLVLGLCFYVPAVRNIFISSDSDDTKVLVLRIIQAQLYLLLIRFYLLLLVLKLTSLFQQTILLFQQLLNHQHLRQLDLV